MIRAEAPPLKAISREQAVKALHEMFHKAFGNDKGSAEVYQEWAADQGLCEQWDEDGPDSPEILPPCIYEILVAAGIRPKQLVDILGINMKIFDREMCKQYKVDTPYDEILGDHIGAHKYPGAGMGVFFYASDCKYDCGCWMWSISSGCRGKDNIDPLGRCPKAPKEVQKAFEVRKQLKEEEDDDQDA